MAMNFEIKLSDKQNEIATAKTDAEWISMNIDEIHTQVFGSTAIASGLLCAQGKRPDRTNFSARVRFLAALVKRGVSISRPAKIIIVWANQSCRTDCGFDPQFVKESK